jgi:hypothetical protein
VPVIVDILAEGRSGARLSLAATLLKLIPVEMRQRVNSRIWNMAEENSNTPRPSPEWSKGCVTRRSPTSIRTARSTTRSCRTWATAILDRIIYSLGMGGRLELLREVAADPTLPDRLRSAASWWTTLPPHIQRSASV